VLEWKRTKQQKLICITVLTARCHMDPLSVSVAYVIKFVSIGYSYFKVMKIKF